MLGNLNALIAAGEIQSDTGATRWMAKPPIQRHARFVRKLTFPLANAHVNSNRCRLIARISIRIRKRLIGHPAVGSAAKT
jgi:hypothetical protein